MKTLEKSYRIIGGLFVRRLALSLKSRALSFKKLFDLFFFRPVQVNVRPEPVQLACLPIADRGNYEHFANCFFGRELVPDEPGALLIAESNYVSIELDVWDRKAEPVQPSK
jgi:hypothetical protein